MRLIDADKLCEDLLTRWELADKNKEDVIRQVMADIVTPIVVGQPTADAVERKRGEWVEEPNCWYRCSKCGKHYPSMRGYMDYNFCPNCGADMRGESNEID